MDMEFGVAKYYVTRAFSELASWTYLKQWAAVSA